MEPLLAQLGIGDFSNILNFASSQNYQGWISLGVNILLSTLVGGIVLILILEILGHEWGESTHPLNAFFLVFVINLINLFGVVGFLSFIPYATIVIPVVVWIILVKLFFHELSIKHAVIVGLIGFTLSMILIPYLVTLASSLLPL